MTQDTRRPRRRWRAIAGPLVLLGLVVVAGWSGVAERLFYFPIAEPTPVPPEFPAGELVRFASADGTKLAGWFLPARDAAPGEIRPAILQVHGNAGNVSHHIGFTDFLPAAGFHLFIFDFRGYGESDGRPRRRDELIADTNAALDVLLARDDVDNGRIGMFAQSLGGGVGLNAMADRPEIRCAVLVSAFTSWQDIAADVLGGGDGGWIARSIARLLIRDHRRPLDAIARIDRPILILHGDADEIIPVTHGRRLAAAAPNAELIELIGADHNSIRETHPAFALAVVDAFRRWLGPF